MIPDTRTDTILLPLTLAEVEKVTGKHPRKNTRNWTLRQYALMAERTRLHHAQLAKLGMWGAA